jgi:LEA14-like dessication related protein
MNQSIVFILFFFIVAACVPREEIELRDIRNLVVEKGEGADPVLAGDAVFYNPNTSRMKLREIKVDVFVDGKKSAVVDQKLKAVARAKSEFTVPLKVQIQLKDIGLADAIKSLFGGKKYEIHYKGHLKVTVNGIPMRVPVDYKDEFKLKF